MSTIPLRLAFCGALTLLGVGSVTLARASVVALHDVGNDAFFASAPPSLLGPVNELGRNGWDCAPERSALAKRAAEARLPTLDDR